MDLSIHLSSSAVSANQKLKLHRVARTRQIYTNCLGTECEAGTPSKSDSQFQVYAVDFAFKRLDSPLVFPERTCGNRC